MPMAMESCTEGMLTSAIHSVTGCSTCRRQRHSPSSAGQSVQPSPVYGSHLTYKHSADRHWVTS